MLKNWLKNVKTSGCYEQVMMLPSFLWEQAVRCLRSIGTVIFIYGCPNTIIIIYSYPSVSSLLLHFPDSKGILLDCGEGTLGQLYRQFGVDTPSVLRNIHCVFISHIHADHHMGLSKLLSKRRKVSIPPYNACIF